MTTAPPSDMQWLDFNNAPDKPPTISSKISRDELKAKLLNSLESTLASLYPGGKIDGKHFVIGDIYGTPGQSLKVNLRGKYKGRWKDFAANDQSGDIFDLFAAVFSIDAKNEFKKLLAKICEWLGEPQHFYREATYKDKSRGSIAQRGAPIDERGMWVSKFDYRDFDGNLIACVYKYLTEKGKTFICWDVVAGKYQAPDPRPLYNLPGIKDAEIVYLCEGEKCADAMIAAGYCGTSVIGGANSPLEKTDWTPLEGKTLVVWPDNDENGKQFAESVIAFIKDQGPASIKLLIPPEQAPYKWDAADAFQQGFNVPAFIDKAVDGVGYEFEPPKIKVRSIGEMLDDTTPMPPDIIGPRVLGYGDIALLVGAAKVGKSDFIMSAAMHWSAGLPFLGLTVDRPLRILYMQAEIGYFFLRERVYNFYPELTNNPLTRVNLAISDKFHYCLDEEGKEEFIKRCLVTFKDGPPDLLIIDPLRNVFHSDRDNATENDNTAMIDFLRNGVQEIQRRVSPEMAIFLLHHINKMPKKTFDEEPFNSISGASSIRGFYTSGFIMHKPSRENPEIKIYSELRNGPAIPTKVVVKQNDQWVELSKEESAFIDQKQQRRNKDAYDERREKIKEILHKEARDKNKLYIRNAFAKHFANKHGLGSQATINRALGEMLGDSTLKITLNYNVYGQDKTNSKHGYLVLEDMFTSVDGKSTRVLPTHFVTKNSSVLKEVENPHVWVYRDSEEQS